MGPMKRAAAAAAGLAVASARSMVDFPLEVRRENVVRITTKECDECMTLEAFYEANPLGFVLFYERQLVGSHKYKEAIVRGFNETCADLRFSRVACGAVDMVEDKQYAEMYIDPKTAPAHIAVRNGEPVKFGSSPTSESDDGLQVVPHVLSGTQQSPRCCDRAHRPLQKLASELRGSSPPRAPSFCCRLRRSGPKPCSRVA